MNPTHQVAPLIASEQLALEQLALEQLAQATPGMIEHMNADHAGNVRDYARFFAKAAWVESATMQTLDRDGFDLEARGDGRLERLRITFAAPLKSAEDAHQVLVKMAIMAASQQTDLEHSRSLKETA